MMHALRPANRRLALLTSACATLAIGLVAARVDASSALAAPVIQSIAGGLRAMNIQFSPSAVTSISAFPLQSPAVTGFTPLVVTTLTDEEAADDFQFTASAASTKIGNALGNGYTYLATLDSGGQSHIVSGPDSVGIDFDAGGRAGDNSIGVAGASGTESLSVTDPLGVWVTGVGNLTNARGAALSATAASYRGQYQTSVLSADPGSALPSIVGLPMYAQYAVNIKNSDTRRIVPPTGPAVRSPDISFVPHGQGAQLQYKLALDLQDPNNSASSDPAFFPSFESFENFSDNPATPTFWSFPIASVNLNNKGAALNQQSFLFDTGAQVSVLSEATADSLGFDVGTDTPDFTIDVLGVGGTTKAPGFFIHQLELPVTGGSAVWTDVPVIVLNVTDPRDGVGFIPGIIGMNLFNDRDMTIDLTTGDPYVRFSDVIAAKWNVADSGTWLPDGNWVLGVPDGVDVPANFLDSITSASTVTVDGDYTIGSMKFDNANSYTIAGTGRLTFQTLGRPTPITVVQGSHTVSAPMTLGDITNVDIAGGAQLTFSGDTATPTAAVTKTGAGTLRLSNARYASLSVNGGTTRILAGLGNASTSKVNALDVATGATLDLADSKMIVDYTGTSPLATLRAEILDGRITSAGVDASHAIGYGEAATLSLLSFGAQSADATSVLIRLTLKGDADLSGGVNFTDLMAVAKNYGQSGRIWTGGDFDGNGVTNFTDLLAMAKNYGGTQPADGTLDAAFAADWAMAEALAPEPSLLAAFAGVVSLVGSRRRRR